MTCETGNSESVSKTLSARLLPVQPAQNAVSVRLSRVAKGTDAECETPDPRSLSSRVLQDRAPVYVFQESKAQQKLDRNILQ